MNIYCRKTLFLLPIILLGTIACQAQSWFNLRNGSDALNANSIIYSICVDDSNNVYAAGSFMDTPSAVYGKTYVAKWNANSLHWDILGTGSNALNANGPINTICADKHGYIYAAGVFTDAPYSYMGKRYVAKWDGVHWSKLGNGADALNALGPINSICVDDSGFVYEAGNFFNSSGHYYVARWNGLKWAEVGSLRANSNINTICIDDSYNIYAAGNFTDSAGHAYVAKYDHAAHYWSELGYGFDTGSSEVIIESIFSDTPNHVYAGVNFGLSSSSAFVGNVFRWNGASWNRLASLNANSWVNTICKGDSGYIYAAGAFKNTSNKNYVAKYDPNAASWSELGASGNPFDVHITKTYSATILSLCVDRNHHVFAAGDFTDSISAENNYWFVAEYGSPPASLDVNLAYGNGLKIYPNPANDALHIEQTTPKANYCLYSVTGIMCAKGILGCGPNTIDISGLPPGLYILSINSVKQKVLKL